jgi:hypothetical protein
MTIREYETLLKKKVIETRIIIDALEAENTEISSSKRDLPYSSLYKPA